LQLQAREGDNLVVPKAHIRVVAAVIERNGRYLLTQRNASAVFPLLWEFPGGRVESGETDSAALVREVHGRIGVLVAISEKLGEHVHEYEDYDVHLTLFACSLPPDAEPRAVGVHDVRWVSSQELDNYEFPPADQTSMTKLLDLAN
jgi:8-oxo-dGTP diphosphatase